MNGQYAILKQHISEQIALEEHLAVVINEQILHIDEAVFAEAKALLKKTTQVLESHFTTLNQLLDKLDKKALSEQIQSVAINGQHIDIDGKDDKVNIQISRLLRDDYSALNLVTISNTLLHTIALALDADEVAATALKHLENLTPLVVKIGHLVPEVVTQELRSAFPTIIDRSTASTAIRNTELAWRKAS